MGGVTKLCLFTFVFEKLLIKTYIFRVQRSLEFFLLMSSLTEAVKTKAKICVSSLKQTKPCPDKVHRSLPMLMY